MSEVLNWIIKNKENDNPAIIYRNTNSDNYQNITYDNLYNYINSLSGYLEKYKGKTIAIIGNNKLEYIVSLLSVLCNIGNVFVIDKELKENELDKIFKKVMPDLIIIDDEIVLKFDDIDVLNFSEINNIMKKNYKFEIDNNFSGNLILHTSGTTGEPKCILLTEEMYLYIIKDLNDAWKVRKKHSCLFIIPLYHIYALTSLFHGLYAGITNILEWDYSRLEDVLKKTNPSIFLGVPLIFNKVKNKAYEKAGKKLDFAIKMSNFLLLFKIDVRKKLFKEIHDYFGNNYFFAVSGGSIANPETHKFFENIGLPLYSGYGMTETAGPVAITYLNNNRYDSVGKILNNEVKIINKDKNGVGEICIKGKNIIKSYLNEENDDFIVDDYFNTGDLGYVKDNYLYITGRKKNVLIGDNAKNISPEELSGKILENKDIYDCTIKMEDNKIIAILDTTLSEKEVETFISKINENLPNYKKISKFKIINKGFKNGNN